jgi:hypothetical protein
VPRNDARFQASANNTNITKKSDDLSITALSSFINQSTQQQFFG